MTGDAATVVRVLEATDRTPVRPWPWHRWVLEALAAFAMPWRAARKTRQHEDAAMYLCDAIVDQHEMIGRLRGES